MDTAQFTNQLVGFSQVEQQLKSNADLDKLVASANSNQTQLGLSYIGLDVSMTGNRFNYDPDKISKVGISYNLASASASTKIFIIDSNGSTVAAVNGSTTKGDNTVTWDGKKSDGSTAPAGTYTVQIGALDNTQNAIAVTTQVPGKVTGMQTAGDGTIQLVIDSTQAVPLSSITSAWIPGSNTTASNNNSTGSGS
jgi:flagellar basal-body rod modification protein FlgD